MMKSYNNTIYWKLIENVLNDIESQYFELLINFQFHFSYVFPSKGNVKENVRGMYQRNVRQRRITALMIYQN